MMSVEITTEPTLRVGTPRELFELRRGLGVFDVTSDGKFVMVQAEPDEIPEGIVMVTNWFEELNRLVPTDD